VQYQTILVQPGPFSGSLYAVAAVVYDEQGSIIDRVIADTICDGCLGEYALVTQAFLERIGEVDDVSRVPSMFGPWVFAGPRQGFDLPDITAFIKSDVLVNGRAC